MRRIGITQALLIPLYAAAMIVTAGACHDPTDVAQFVSVRVDGAQFQLSIEGAAAVPFSVVNPGDDTVYVERCGGDVNAAVDKWQDNGWTQYRSGICAQDAVFGPVVLGPGEHTESTTELNEPGRYRLRAGAWAGSGTQTNWNAASNAFDVLGPAGSP